MWEKRFIQYAADPYAEWPEDRHPQAKKLIRGLTSTGKSPAQAVEEIVEIEHWRLRGRPPTLFVVNCGSSGSHWLTTMLGELSGVVDCGQVYLPTGLLAETKSWDPADRAALIDCTHLAHGRRRDRTTRRSMLVNSAHLAGWRIAKAFGDEARVVLLIRDPLDIVLSRTFRKPDYRQLLCPNVSDWEYLNTNISYVKRAVASVSKDASNSHLLCVRYEDLLDSWVTVLGEVCAVAGIRASRLDLDRAASRHGKGSPTTNAFQAIYVDPPPELVREATVALESERRAWGYIP